MIIIIIIKEYRRISQVQLTQMRSHQFWKKQKHLVTSFLSSSFPLHLSEYAALFCLCVNIHLLFVSLQFFFSHFPSFFFLSFFPSFTFFSFLIFPSFHPLLVTTKRAIFPSLFHFFFPYSNSFTFLVSPICFLFPLLCLLYSVLCSSHW